MENYHMSPTHDITILLKVFEESVHWIKVGELLVFRFNSHNFHQDKCLKYSADPIIMVFLKTMRNSTWRNSKSVLIIETEFSRTNRYRYTLFKGNKNTGVIRKRTWCKWDCNLSLHYQTVALQSHNCQIENYSSSPANLWIGACKTFGKSTMTQKCMSFSDCGK